MPYSQVYRNIEDWKKPLHVVHAYLAKIYFKFLPSTQVIGVTGSVGKTLTQNAICSVLSKKFKIVCGDENLDPTYRIPKTIFAARPWHKFIVLEYGVEHPQDMDYYLWLARPQFAIVTNIALTHTKYFKSEKGVYAEKVKLIKALPPTGTAILNKNDKVVAEMKSQTKANVFWFGKTSKMGIKISDYSQDLRGSTFRMHFHKDKAAVSWKIIGKHQLLSAQAAASMGIVAGLSLKQIASGLSQVEVPLHRLNVVKTQKAYILDDTYNSSPKAAKESIETLVDLGATHKKLAILGEMKDLGSLSTTAHIDLGEFISKTNIDHLITIGKVAKLIGKSARKNKFKGQVLNYFTTQQALVQAQKLTSENSLILIKGSRHAHLERIVFALQGKSTQISCYQCGNLK
ncbi:hypothetical protein A3J17_00450 [Candidatus Curtissbacteria bacterium RIFCSPLOWO2_02_FULL_40_11]|nr:MAG: hypothetical protein A3J17_00450 [Candidatus Curtissbacteria bacterium RIFCSPLOWO2_02_FULL_40_11]